MSGALSMAAPLIVGAVCLWAWLRGVNVYTAMCRGAEKGLSVLSGMLPALVCLFPALWLFRESALAGMLTKILEPVFAGAGIPPETGMLMLLRPLSGSAALSEAAALIEAYGADSLIGRTAAVMLGSSETSFYVIAVYFSAAGVKNSRWALPAALAADLACFFASAWVCRLFWA